MGKLNQNFKIEIRFFFRFKRYVTIFFPKITFSLFSNQSYAKKIEKILKSLIDIQQTLNASARTIKYARPPAQ